MWEKILVGVLAGLGAGLGTGFAGMSAAAVIAPMLTTFLGMDPYLAVGVALSSDVLASVASAYTYGKNKNLDIRNGAIMMAAVLAMTVVGSFVSSLVPGAAMGSLSVFMTMILGVRFLVRPVTEPKARFVSATAKQKAIRSLLGGALVGFICGFVGAGGGMMMLLVLTSFLGYELKTAVGTSVFIMSATALTGSISHFALGGLPDLLVWGVCVGSTLVFALLAARIANRVSAKTLNRVVGALLVLLGVVILGVKYL